MRVSILGAGPSRMALERMYTLVAVVYPVICLSLPKAVELRWKAHSS